MKSLKCFQDVRMSWAWYSVYSAIFSFTYDWVCYVMLFAQLHILRASTNLFTFWCPTLLSQKYRKNKSQNEKPYMSKSCISKLRFLHDCDQPDTLTYLVPLDLPKPPLTPICLSFPPLTSWPFSTPIVPLCYPCSPFNSKETHPIN